MDGKKFYDNSDFVISVNRNQTEDEAAKEILLNANKRLAQFLGYTYYPYGTERSWDPGWKLFPEASSFAKQNIRPNSYLCRSHKGLNFDKSWDRLEMVMDKIISLGFKVEFGGRLDHNGKQVYFCAIYNDGNKTPMINMCGLKSKQLMFDCFSLFVLMTDQPL